MTDKEIVDSLLHFAEIVMSWPIIVLIILLIFRGAIDSFLPDLAKRISKAEVPGGKFEFSPVAVNALQDAIEEGAEELKDKPEQLVGFVRKQINKLPEMQAATQPTAQPNLSGRSILWVDDNPMNNVYEASVLKRYGASIIFVRSTDEALNFLNKDHFDLIISDMGRFESGQNNFEAGYELLEKLPPSHKKTPLIYYMGNVGRLIQNRSSNAYGAADTPGELIRLITHAFQTSS